MDTSDSLEKGMTIRDDDYIRLNYISDFIEDFVAPSHRSRLHYLLSKPKRRNEIINHFHSDTYLDSRYLHSIDTRDLTALKIFHLMKEAGATSKCFALSLQEPLGAEVTLESALNEYFGSCSAIILYCRESKVGYWEGGHCDRFILHKSRN